MDLLAITAYIFSVGVGASFLHYSHQAMIINSPQACKSFLAAPLFDVFALLVFGVPMAPFYLFTYWLSIHLIKSISTSKLVTKPNVIRFILFISFLYPILLYIISTANPFVVSNYSQENVIIFFSNHIPLSIGFYILILFITISQSGFQSIKIKLILLSFVIFVGLSLYSYAIFLFALEISEHVMWIVIVSIVMVSLLFFRFKREMKSYIKSEPNLGPSSHIDNSSQNALSNYSDFDGVIGNIRKRRNYDTEQPNKIEYPTPKICPKCKSELSEDGYCESCVKRVCPKCFNQMSKKSIFCTCGFVFDGQIIRDSSNKIGKSSEKSIYTQDEVSQEKDSDNDSILVEGVQNIPRICPYCQAIGWKDDICRCGYNYITKTHPGQIKPGKK